MVRCPHSSVVASDGMTLQEARSCFRLGLTIVQKPYYLFSYYFICQNCSNALGFCTIWYHTKRILNRVVTGQAFFWYDPSSLLLAWQWERFDNPFNMAHVIWIYPETRWQDTWGRRQGTQPRITIGLAIWLANVAAWITWGLPNNDHMVPSSQVSCLSLMKSDERSFYVLNDNFLHNRRSV